jgi:hypothetical protein
LRGEKVMAPVGIGEGENATTTKSGLSGCIWWICVED